MCSPLSRYKPNKIYTINGVIDVDAVEPVTLDQIKAWLVVTFNDDDIPLTLLGKQCRDGVEQYCKIALVDKTFTVVADLYEDSRLPFGPAIMNPTVSIRNGTVYEAYTGFGYDADANLFCPGTSGRFKIVYPVTGMDMVNNASLQLDLLRIIAYCYENKGDQQLSTLQGGQTRPSGLDQALELFAFKYVDMSWV